MDPKLIKKIFNIKISWIIFKKTDILVIGGIIYWSIALVLLAIGLGKECSLESLEYIITAIFPAILGAQLLITGTLIDSE